MPVSTVKQGTFINVGTTFYSATRRWLVNEWCVTMSAFVAWRLLSQANSWPQCGIPLRHRGLASSGKLVILTTARHSQVALECLGNVQGTFDRGRMFGVRNWTLSERCLNVRKITCYAKWSALIPINMVFFEEIETGFRKNACRLIKFAILLKVRSTFGERSPNVRQITFSGHSPNVWQTMFSERSPNVIFFNCIRVKNYIWICHTFTSKMCKVAFIDELWNFVYGRQS